MRFGIMSDSHGDMKQVEKAVQDMGQVDYILHAGDHYRDALALREKIQTKVVGVGGNCDLMMQTPKQHIGKYGGKKLLLIHGHQYGVKRGLQSLVAHAKQRRIDMVVFGHTHIPTVEEMDKVLLFNPGSVAFPRYRGKPTYGIIDIDEEGIIPKIVSLPNNVG